MIEDYAAAIPVEVLREEQMTEPELLHNCIFLLNAGHETTTNLIGNSLHALLHDPGSLVKLRDTPQLIDSILRAAPTVILQRRHSLLQL